MKRLSKVLVVLVLWLIPIVVVGATLQRLTLQPEQIEGGYKIVGYVTDEATGSPLQNATVSLAECQGAVATAKEDGYYAVLSVPTGVYTLWSAKDGYKTDKRPVQVINKDLFVNVTLTPIGILPPPPPGNTTIVVTVTDAKTGLPIGGASINFGSPVRTGSDGIYSFSVIEGTYAFTVSMKGYETKTALVVATEKRVYSVAVSLTPKAPVPTIMLRAELSSGTHSGVTDSYIAIQGKVGTSRLTVTVTKSDGTRASGIPVSFSASEGPHWIEVTFDSSTAVTGSAGTATVQLTCTAPYWQGHINSVKITASATVEEQKIQDSQYLDVVPTCATCH